MARLAICRDHQWQAIQRGKCMHPLKNLATYLYDARDTVCVASSPRSGSTWLAETLVDLGHYDWVDEPLRLENGELRPHGFTARSCLLDASGEREAAIARKMREVLCGRVGHLQLSWRLRRRLLLKFVRINRMLAWATDEFDLQRNILLVRHPCAVVASQLAMHGGNSKWSNMSSPAPDIPSYLEAQVRSLADGSAHRSLAINWAIDQRIPVYDFVPRNTLLVFYEDLMADPEGGWRKICDFCGIRYEALSGRPSATASSDFSVAAQIDKWREKLPMDIAEDILHTCHALGVELYDMASSPRERPW